MSNNIQTTVVSNTTNHRYVEQRKSVCGGEPIVVGTRIPVRIIAGWMKMGKSVDEIAMMYPNLNHAKIYDALSYYYDNKDSIDILLRENTIEYQMAATEGKEWRKRSSTLMKT
jgi:uncharacterized protein (DUF433 family)